MHSYENFVKLRDGALNLTDFQHIGQTVAVANQRFHCGPVTERIAKYRALAGGVDSSDVIKFSSKVRKCNAVGTLDGDRPVGITIRGHEIELPFLPRLKGDWLC